MRCHENGPAGFELRAHDVYHHGDASVVEGREGFVEEPQRHPANGENKARERNAAMLARRHLLTGHVIPVREPNPRECRRNHGWIGVEALESVCPGKILRRSQSRRHTWPMPEEEHVALAICALDPPDPDMSRMVDVQARDAAQERGFSGAVRAPQLHDLARRNRQIERREQHPVVTLAGETLEFEQWCGQEGLRAPAGMRDHSNAPAEVQSQQRTLNAKRRASEADRPSPHEGAG